jgi:PEP-CTERM motif
MGKPDHRTVRRVFLVCGMLALAVSARANSSSYLYTGDPFNNVTAYSDGCSGTYATGCSGFITISFSVSSSLIGASNDTITPSSFSLSDQDGLTITDATATASTFTVSTDGSGNITAWYISACISSTNCTDGTQIVQQITSGSGNISPGSPRPADISFDDFYPSTGSDPTAGQFCLTDNQAGLSCQEYATVNSGVNLAWAAYQFGDDGTWVQDADVPEPSTVLLLGAGFLALAGWRRVHAVN